MASWVLECSSCGKTFPHSEIEDRPIENFFLPAKPQFPEAGLEVGCPHCGNKSKYQRADLTYRA
jgi:DNA-directed RNA polymerase subunit RPC12/RpoP